MYTCIVIDDQEESVNLIKDHIGNIPLLQLLYSSTNPLEGLAFLDKTRPDIIFLDIEMPELNGVDLIETLKEKWGKDIPQIVFVTGFNQYALEGFDLGVSDYLLKPVSFKRFKKAIDRIVYDLDSKNRHKPGDGFIFVDAVNQKARLNFGDIVYIEGARNYINIITGNKRYMLYKSVKSMMDILPSTGFIRIHKSYLVSVDKIVALNDNRVTLNVEGKEEKLPIGQTYKRDVFKKLNITG